MTDSHFQTLEDILSDLTALREERYTYDEIGAMRGISGGLAWSMINTGYDPQSPQIRKRLNLPPLTAEAPYCAKHDTVHCYDCETEQVKPKPAPRPKRKRTPYFKCRPDDIQQTMKQLEKYYPGEFERTK